MEMEKIVALIAFLGSWIMGTQPGFENIKEGDVYYVIENSKLKPAEKPDSQHFYVKGHFEGERFVVSGQVVSNAPFSSDGDGTPGWFELSSQRFYSQQTAQEPQKPYIIGYMTSNGFVPSKRDIY